MFVVLTFFTCIVLVDGRWMTGMAAVNEEEYAVPADHHLLSQLPTVRVRAVVSLHLLRYVKRNRGMR